MEIPAEFARRMIDVGGEEGVAWLAALPDLLDRYARRWGLTIGPPFDLSYNYVAPAVRADGAAVVLKLGLPRPLARELAALQWYNGAGMVQLLDADAAQGVLLLERAQPATPLADLAATDDAAATAIAAGVMRQLWRPGLPDYPFPTVAEWAADLARLRPQFGGGTGPFPAPLVAQAERLFADLLPSQAAPVLLHGDLHHWNILAATRQPWLALDPKGVVGEPAYEVGALLRNPLPDLLAWPDPARVLAHRVDQLSELLGFDRARVAAWGMAQAVLSAWWTYEDHGEVGEEALICADYLARLLD